MGLCDYMYGSSSSSDFSDSDTCSSTVSVPYFFYSSEKDIRYPSSHRNRSHTTLSKKKRTWSETEPDNESTDLPGVPDYIMYPQASGSSARLCYDSDAGSDSDDDLNKSRENNMKKRKRRAGNGNPVVAAVPIAGSSVRDLKSPLPAAPRPTTAAVKVRNVLGRRRRPGAYQPWWKNRFHIGNLDVDVDGLGYLSINGASSPLHGTGREDEAAAPRVAARPPLFVHTYPTPKPTTTPPINVRLRKADLPARACIEPTPAVPKSVWLGVTKSWAFPSPSY